MSIPAPIDTTDKVSTTRWVLNLLTNPAVVRWLLLDQMRFASLFAVLRPHIELPQDLSDAAGLGSESENVRVYQQQIEDWRKADQMPVRGRVSSRYLRSLWEGVRISNILPSHTHVWERAVQQWVRESSEVETGLRQRLSEQANSLAQSPSLPLPQPASDFDGTGIFDINLLLFSSTTNIRFTEDEVSVMRLSFALASDEALRLFFEHIQTTYRGYETVVPVMLDIDYDVLSEMLCEYSRTASLGIVPLDPSTRQILPMHEFWQHWFSDLFKTTSEAIEKFLVPLRMEKNSGALARLAPRDTETVSRLLVESSGLYGTNVLLYGPSSIDKIGWVRQLAQSHTRSVYTLPSTLPDAVRASVCYVAQRLLPSLDEKAWLVIPRADTVLTRTQRGRHQFLFMELEFESEADDQAIEARLLSENPTPTVWLVNSPDRISENNIGRFLYTCELKAASRAERRVEIQEILAPLSLSEGFINELSQHLRISEQQLRSAVDLCSRFHHFYASTDNEQKRLRREELVRRSIEQSQKALNRRQREDLRQSITQYSLDYLNLRSSFSVPQIIESLRREPCASVCLYGLPGTGKTQLAEYIAVELDKPLLIKRASDILGKYVGENEKNIKLMFDQASDEDAVLLLDEADSFLRDRSLARQGWEVSTVNELLQGMERHRGIFICTTNLFNSIDLAALRRFTFKLEFIELNEDQRWQMFLNEGGFTEKDFSDQEREKYHMDLALIRGLAPGDFATIQRQVRLLDQPLSASGWINALQEEARAKLREASYGVGGTQTV